MANWVQHFFWLITIAYMLPSILDMHHSFQYLNLQVWDVIEHFVVHIGMLKWLLEVTPNLCAVMKLLNQ